VGALPKHSAMDLQTLMRNGLKPESFRKMMMPLGWQLNVAKKYRPTLKFKYAKNDTIS
jgi:hypothetical protein